MHSLSSTPKRRSSVPPREKRRSCVPLLYYYDPSHSLLSEVIFCRKLQFPPWLSSHRNRHLLPKWRRFECQLSCPFCASSAHRSRWTLIRTVTINQQAPRDPPVNDAIFSVMRRRVDVENAMSSLLTEKSVMKTSTKCSEDITSSIKATSFCTIVFT